MGIQQALFMVGGSSGNANPPVVAASATSSIATGGGTLNATLPTGIASGHLLVLVISKSANTATAAPSGWTKAKEIATNGPAQAIFTRTADGSEGASVAVSTGGNNMSAICFRITNWQGPLMFSTGLQARSATPDPDAVTSSYTETKALAIAALSWSNSSFAFPSYPSNFADNRVSVKDSAGDASGTGVSLCTGVFDITNGGTVNPNTFSFGASDPFYTACTILIRSNG